MLGPGGDEGVSGLEGAGLLLCRMCVGGGGGVATAGLRLGVDLRDVSRAEMREAAPEDERNEDRAGEAEATLDEGV